MMVDSISRLFAHSPIRPIQMHMKKVQETVVKLGDFAEATYESDWDKAEKVRAEINEHEHEADALKEDLRSSLPKSLLMPVARADVLALLGMQDKLANKSKDISGLMLGRKMQVPAAIQAEFREFLSRCIESTAKAFRAIEELDDLFETGFSRNERAKVQVFLEEVDRQESECDSLQVKLRASLMAIEETEPPVQVFFLYRVIEEIGELSDIAHRVGSRLTILLAR